MNVCVCMYVYTLVFEYVCLHMYVFIHVCMFVCVCVHVCLLDCVCVSVPGIWMHKMLHHQYYLIHLAGTKRNPSNVGLI